VVVVDYHRYYLAVGEEEEEGRGWLESDYSWSVSLIWYYTVSLWCSSRNDRQKEYQRRKRGGGGFTRRGRSKGELMTINVCVFRAAVRRIVGIRMVYVYNNHFEEAFLPDTHVCMHSSCALLGCMND
jgi:hypothetical protein